MVIELFQVQTEPFLHHMGAQRKVTDLAIPFDIAHYMYRVWTKVFW